MQALPVIVFFVTGVSCQDFRILGLFEPQDAELRQAVSEVVSRLGTNYISSRLIHFEAIDRVSGNDSATWQHVCSSSAAKGLSAILDFSWDGLSSGTLLAEKYGIAYHRVDSTIRSFIQATDDFLKSIGAADAAFIFQSYAEMDQGLFYLIDGTTLRFIALEKLDDDAIARLRKMRPTRAYYAILAEGQTAQALISKVYGANLATRNSHWTLVLTDFSYSSAWISNLKLPESMSVSIISPNTETCCAFTQQTQCSACNFKIRSSAVKEASSLAFAAMKNALEANRNLVPMPMKISCDLAEPYNRGNNAFQSELSAALDKLRLSQSTVKKGDRNESYFDLNMTVFAANKQGANFIGSWRRQTGFVRTANFKSVGLRRIFRVGMVLGAPWLYVIGKDGTGKDLYGGYCKEMLDKLAEKANFDYDIILARDGRYGVKLPNGSWTGLVGELAAGETDMVVAALTMTTEREEIIDFVTPYFEQSGMSIVIRRQVQDSDLFKFMSVLKWEVWMSMLAALVVTGILLWILERLSPYSARNKAYPNECRRFTLQESLWFALTSFTPQGGGEPPKSLSSRILVAAYWLFVVLMLAAFTANLAAFLTVERMLTPVTSLEELARQSQINYTVVRGTVHERYFMNMANAEEELFKVWKEMTLNSPPSEQAKFILWDYPIKEQYTHIWRVINASGMALSKEEGFRKVDESTKGEVALIHDTSEIMYEVYKNCNLTVIGRPFGEQPYGVAVQQGSSLQAEMSKVILELQKDRYFETLRAKYWNSSRMADCNDADGAESGIDLRSLGVYGNLKKKATYESLKRGVFIAAGVGLGVAIGIMGLEIVYYKYPTACNFLRKRNTHAAATPNKSDGNDGKKAIYPKGLDSAPRWNSSTKMTTDVFKPEVQAGWR